MLLTCSFPVGHGIRPSTIEDKGQRDFQNKAHQSIIHYLHKCTSLVSNGNQSPSKRQASAFHFLLSAPFPCLGNWVNVAATTSSSVMLSSRHRAPGEPCGSHSTISKLASALARLAHLKIYHSTIFIHWVRIVVAARGMAMVLCTKLVQCLCGGGALLVAWFLLLSGLLPLQLSPQLQEVTVPVS